MAVCSVGILVVIGRNELDLLRFFLNLDGQLAKVEADGLAFNPSDSIFLFLLVQVVMIHNRTIIQNIAFDVGQIPEEPH